MMDVGFRAFLIKRHHHSRRCHAKVTARSATSEAVSVPTPRAFDADSGVVEVARAHQGARCADTVAALKRAV